MIACYKTTAGFAHTTTFQVTPYHSIGQLLVSGQYVDELLLLTA